MKKTPFIQWLLEQASREDYVGDLASDYLYVLGYEERQGITHDVLSSTQLKNSIYRYAGQGAITATSMVDRAIKEFQNSHK